MPEVSVIIPIYNTAAYLRKALDSICSQTLKELEIILIDDGSTDGSRGIIEEYAKRDARIRWYAQPNQGLSVARNRGFIIRKTKCSPLFKRSDISYKTKRPPKNNFPKYSRGSKKSTGKFCFSQCFFL